jgi:hypothetical protein
MSKWMMFNRTFDARPDRIDFRDLQYRPRLVNLPAQYPSEELINHYLPAYRAKKLILDQGEEGSCTGFGLAAVVNYRRWEHWLTNQKPSKKIDMSKAPSLVSARMLYQNARLYDEWKGDDYEGSSCRGAMKGFHKHGVCAEEYWPNFADENKKKPGSAKDGWDANAPLAPLGAYFRVDSRSLVDMQSAIFETHAIYVSADAHDGWDAVRKSRDLGSAVIKPKTKKEVGGHAFAIVGYTSDGFIIQNSWGADWGYLGFALLPYEEWTRHGNDAWTLALGAPMAIRHPTKAKGKRAAYSGARFLSPGARTEISLDERLRVRGPLLAGAAADQSAAPPWVEGEEQDHIIYIGHAGRAQRELVSANDGDHAVRIVIGDKLKNALKNGVNKIAIYDHGGLNAREDGVKRAQILGPWFVKNGIHPIFVVWQSGFFESAGDIIRIGAEKLGVLPERVEGWLVDKLKDAKDRGFEVFARDFGVKAIWENMKLRARNASEKGGGLATAADGLYQVIGSLQRKPEIHLLGHSAGCIMHGNFLGAMKAANLTASSIHLWAPACTVDFANRTYGTAFSDGTADPKSTFVSILDDANEKRDACVPVVYSKSLLYLVSRALEPDHKTPVLGLQRIWPKWRQKDETFNSDLGQAMSDWDRLGKGVVLDAPVTDTTVPTRKEPNNNEAIDANHGSFDNNIDVVNKALVRILGKNPKVPVTDLRGF